MPHFITARIDGDIEMAIWRDSKLFFFKKRSVVPLGERNFCEVTTYETRPAEHQELHDAGSTIATILLINGKRFSEKFSYQISGITYTAVKLTQRKTHLPSLQPLHYACPFSPSRLQPVP